MRLSSWCEAAIKYMLGYLRFLSVWLVRYWLNLQLTCWANANLNFHTSTHRFRGPVATVSRVAVVPVVFHALSSTSDQKPVPNFVIFWWRQLAAGLNLNCASCRGVEVNALSQAALRQFTQWLWIEHPTFQLGGGHFTRGVTMGGTIPRAPNHYGGAER